MTGRRAVALFAVVLAATTAATACSDPGAGAEAPTLIAEQHDGLPGDDLRALEGGSWTFSHGTVDGEEASTGGEPVSISISRRGDVVTIGGSACNSMSVTLPGWPDDLATGEGTSTTIDCQGSALARAEGVLQLALTRLEAIAGDPSTITILGPDLALTFTASGPGDGADGAD